MHDIDTTVAAWRSDIVLPLRLIRRLKNGPEPAPNDITEALRARVKKAEIEAEQIEQSALACWFERRYSQQGPMAVEPGDVLQSVVNYFVVRHSAPTSAATSLEVEEAMKILLQSTEPTK